MPDREPAHEIEDVAIDWATRAERGLTTDERTNLDTWLAQDSRHLGAFVRAQAAWIHAERAGALGAMPDGRKPVGETDADRDAAPLAWEVRQSRGFSRRAALGAGGALAASVAAASILGIERYRTLESGVGEIRHIALKDGATLTLDTDTQVDIAQSSGDRRLELVRGKLFLEVAAAASGPLIVKAGALLIETREGAFGVEALRDLPVTALAAEGQLLVSQGQGLFAERIQRIVRPGQQLVVPRSGALAAAQVKPLVAAERERLLAWRDGMLSFGGETLAEAAQAFARYSATRIVLADPQLARQRVTGLFKANDPKGFAEAVAASFGAVVSSNGDVVRIAAKKISSG